MEVEVCFPVSETGLFRLDDSLLTIVDGDARYVNCSCLPEVNIVEIHPRGRYIKLRNISTTKVRYEPNCGNYMLHC